VHWKSEALVRSAQGSKLAQTARGLMEYQSFPQLVVGQLMFNFPPFCI
jgi:hypothetical protein